MERDVLRLAQDGHKAFVRAEMAPIRDPGLQCVLEELHIQKSYPERDRATFARFNHLSLVQGLPHNAAEKFLQSFLQ